MSEFYDIQIGGRHYAINKGADGRFSAPTELLHLKGLGTSLKPAFEPIILARKPLAKGLTVAANVLAHGTGALNIDGCRVEHVTVDGGSLATNPHLREHINGGNGGHVIATETERRIVTPHAAGRWPANLILDGSPAVVGQFPAEAGAHSGVKGTEASAASTGRVTNVRARVASEVHGDAGSAARFFKACRFSEDDQWPPHESNAPAARSAGSPSGSCETPIAAAVAETKTSAFKSEESPAFQACTASCESFTRPHSHVNVEPSESTDTIPTTASLLKSSGCARRAIGESTSSASRGVGVDGSGQEMGTRFLYCAKASSKDRHEGLEHPGPQFKKGSTLRDAENLGADHEGNKHATVKPTALMRYLVRLVTPPGGTVVDPFMGSGSTGKAAVLEGFNFIGFELDPDDEGHVEVAAARIAAAQAKSEASPPPAAPATAVAPCRSAPTPPPAKKAPAPAPQLALFAA